MTRTQAGALLAGSALGVALVTASIILARKDGRMAARAAIQRTSSLGSQAKVVGGRVIGTARVQYQSFTPRAAEALTAAMTSLPKVAEVVTSRMSGQRSSDHLENVAVAE